MAYNTKPILKDVDGKPVPQYFNPIDDQYEELRGTAGASRTILYDSNGNPVSVVNNKIAVRASEIESILLELWILISNILDTTGIKKITDPIKLAGNGIMLQGNITLTGAAQQLHSNTPCKL